jgi:very-short-patch-repair endonuclease
MNNKQYKGLINNFRHNDTYAERVLWLKLRNRQLQGIKFRRQQPVGDYIVDFITFEKCLVIEIDGGQHNENRNSERDEIRTKWLNSQGFHVLRFWNHEVLDNLEGVIAKIHDVIDNGYPLT